ncbi:MULTISPECIES: DUF2213 domain-containing protein [unclassified Pantoea]|uniref:DUF2213 domain-containing protein n=1 Tax=unclassified Pantoea TaxID=2630326 RepID=UPI001CD1C02B|nr:MULTISPECIES: DUF2213 domain-containing protein [unclassified Pantoea]MCA1178875.1 DUF2213 domain-containing protein [Pantoea sp. alder69]MCA1253812.1 DUF2213 domain-containing protein [Pantoea sp. alder70]MCA1267364.1 DUF2213 domain-containing protein [Pantoea sp. alder81]
MSRICVNVLSVINSASNITTETINGAEHIVVKNVVPVRDGIVLNGGLYPAEENTKGYKSLEDKPMPYGHPKVDGRHVSASNVRAVNEYHIGAYTRNVRKENGQVLTDAVINRRFAEGSEKGRKVLQRLDDMAAGKSVEPIGISTGLLLNRIEAKGESNGKRYTWIATNQVYDHVAILLDEPPAGTPEEGIGMFVNAEGDEVQVETVNLSDCDTPDPQDPALKQMFNHFMAFFSANNKPVKEEVNPMKELITNALKAKGIDVEGNSDAELMDAYNQMAADDAKAKSEAEEKAKKEKEEAERKAKETATNSDEMPAWAKLLADDLAAVKSGLAVNSDKEKADKRAAVKAKFQLDDLAVNALEGAALDGLYAQCQTTTGLNGGLRQVNNTNSFSEMPE